MSTRRTAGPIHYVLSLASWKTPSSTNCAVGPGVRRDEDGVLSRARQLAWRRHPHDRRPRVQRLDLETGDALVVGGDVLQLLQRQHVGNHLKSIGGALLDHLHH